MSPFQFKSFKPLNNLCILSKKFNLSYHKHFEQKFNHFSLNFTPFIRKCRTKSRMMMMSDALDAKTKYLILLKNSQLRVMLDLWWIGWCGIVPSFGIRLCEYKIGKPGGLSLARLLTWFGVIGAHHDAAKFSRAPRLNHSPHRCCLSSVEHFLCFARQCINHNQHCLFWPTHRVFSVAWVHKN